jgi:hypothetical protein
MKTHLGMTLLALAISAGNAAAADPETRTGPASPECVDRNADPDKCVTRDGPPRLPIVRKKAEQQPALNQPASVEQPKPPVEKARQTASPKTN